MNEQMSPVPVTTDEFNALCEGVFKEHGYPDKPGYRHMVASLILHLPDDAVEVCRKKVAAQIKKAQANEVAFFMIQKAKEEIEAQQKELEATEQVKSPEAV